jgi:hypothetical protein
VVCAGVRFVPVADSSPQQIVRNARDRAESAEDCQEASNKYKVYNKMSSTLLKVSKKVRKDEETKKGLDKLEKNLKKVNLRRVEELKNYQVHKLFIICVQVGKLLYFSDIFTLKLSFW